MPWTEYLPPPPIPYVVTSAIQHEYNHYKLEWPRMKFLFWDTVSCGAESELDDSSRMGVDNNISSCLISLFRFLFFFVSVCLEFAPLNCLLVYDIKDSDTFSRTGGGGHPTIIQNVACAQRE